MFCVKLDSIKTLILEDDKRKSRRKKIGCEKYGYQKPQIPLGRTGKLDFGDGFLYIKKIQYTPEKMWVSLNNAWQITRLSYHTCIYVNYSIIQNSEQ